MKSFHYERIVENFRTLDDLHSFSSQIDMLVVTLFQANSQSFKETLETRLQRNFGNLLIEALTQQSVSLENHEELQAFFSGLQDALNHLPVLQLTLAYTPMNEQIEELSNWIRQQTGKSVILTLHYDKRILGGAIVTYGGKYADLTLKKRMDTVYEAKKPEILTLLAEPVHNPPKVDHTITATAAKTL